MNVRSRRNTILGRHSGLILLGAFVAASVCCISGCRPVAKADAAGDENAGPVVKVSVQPVKRTSLDETIEVLGVTQPLRNRTARVTTAIEGRVAEILPETPAAAGTEHQASTEATAADSTSASDAPTAKHVAVADPKSTRAVEGEMVTERQVIARLDDRLAKAAVAKAEGALAEARAAVLAQSAPRQPQLEAAEAAAASAQTALEAAEAQFARLSKISDLVGPAQVNDAKTAVERAKADKHAADARLAELGQSLVDRKAVELQAKVRAAQADLKAAEMQLELTNIRSPIAGRLGRVSVFLGQSLPVGTPVANVTDLRQIQVDVAVAAKRIGDIRVGHSAAILLGDGADGKELSGKVTFVGQEIEQGSGSFPVSVVAENPDERLKAGVPVRARIVARHLDNVLVVPRSAVIDETDEPYLFVVEKDTGEGDKKESDKKETAESKDAKSENASEHSPPATAKDAEKTDESKQGKGEDEAKLIARKVSVKVGVRSGDLVQVEGKGLAEGAKVVTEGNYFLPDKAKVEIQGAEEKKEPVDKKE